MGAAEMVVLTLAIGVLVLTLHVAGIAVREAREAFRGIRILWPWTPR